LKLVTCNSSDHKSLDSNQFLKVTEKQMNKKEQTLLVGAHVSTSGGVFNGIAHGEEIGATAIQIFSKNQTRWISKPLSDKDVEKFKESWKNSAIKEVVIHGSYLINLASPDPVVLEKSKNAFRDEVERAEQLGIRYLIFHPGSHLKTGEETGLKKIAESLNRVIEKTPNYSVRQLLETTAGQGTNLGYKFEQLATIIDFVEDKNRVGVCLDTAHIFAAGYDIRNRENYEDTWKTFEKILGMDILYAIHVNDSKKEMGSRVDRHENIGEGLIGEETFRLMMNDPNLEMIPKILETPGGLEEHQRNLETLKSFVSEK